MTENPVQPTVQQLAEELVALHQEILSRQQEASALKRQIIASATSRSYECLGGRVTIVQASQMSQLDPETLIQLLFERGFLSRLDAEALINEGKIERPKEAYVSIRLNSTPA